MPARCVLAEHNHLAGDGMSTMQFVRLYPAPEVREMDCQEELAHCRIDPVHCIGCYGVIRHPMLGAVPFTLWPWQADLLRTLHRQHRVIILKARQLGASELVAAYALWLVRFTPGALVLLISRNHTEANALLERAVFLHAHWPDWLRCPDAAHPGRGRKAEVPAQPVVTRSTARIFEIGHPINGALITSRIESLPATRSTGRSRAATLVILDEWAHQPWQDEIWTALQPTIATGGSIVGISTANGMGNRFQRIWQEAVDGKNGFTAVFLPWSAHPERDEQWYGRQLDALDSWQVHQEYPSDPLEAFVQSGQPVFDLAVLQRHTRRITNAAPSISKDDGLEIWEKSLAGRTYIIGADVAEGIAGGDYDAACVIDRSNGRQVASLHGRWPPDEFAARLSMLGRHYGDALLAVERNNHGHAVLLALVQIHRYPHLARQTDLIDGRGEQRLGWLTTMRTKPIIITALRQGLREESYLPREPGFLAECLSYVRLPSGGMGATHGLHDDRVMAHAIAWFLASQPDVIQQSITTTRQLEDLRQHWLTGEEMGTPDESC